MTARPFDAALAVLVAPDDAAAAAAIEHHARLTKPAGALGRLEALGAQLAAIAGAVPPPLPAPAWAWRPCWPPPSAPAMSPSPPSVPTP